MNARADNSFGIDQQRGFWLRCFLERELLILVILSFLSVQSAQGQAAIYDCFGLKTVKMSKVQGLVLDQQGTPISGASVVLTKPAVDAAEANALSDGNGRFEFDSPSGKFWLRAKLQGFSPTTVPVWVDHGHFGLKVHRMLYVVLAVGGIPPPCPSGITSKKVLQEYIKTNATQK